ncbi:hypothetical protein F4808DRAFT_474896 [Astrocystis sublimbata]|nr:hypothetical protein F4808DRAFT_474896 [Astrocystis sublimbata]
MQESIDHQPGQQTLDQEDCWQRFVRHGNSEILLRHLRKSGGQLDKNTTSLGWIDYAEREGLYHYRTWDRFEREERAYNQLKALQGSCIPRYYGTYLIDMPNAPEDVDPVYFTVPVIMRQHIRGFKLSMIVQELTGAQPDVLTEIIQTATNIARMINILSVVKEETGPGDVIVARDSNGRFKPFLCGFGDTMIFSDALDLKQAAPFFENPGHIGEVMRHKIKLETGMELKIDTWP